MWFAQCCLGVQNVHNNNIFHRDLKPENVFLAGEINGIVKIGDFGLAKVIQSNSAYMQTLAGTLTYMAPEQIQGKPYNEKADAWSLGVILYEMVCSKHPFNGSNAAELLMKVLMSEPEEIPSRVTPETKMLILSLLRKDPKERLSIEGALQVPVVRQRIALISEEAIYGDHIAYEI